MTVYAALIVDLKRSRDYQPERRSALQSYLVELTDELNRLFCDSLERELRFSGGDELQGLFRSPSAAWLCLRLLRRTIHPVAFHAGLGVGEWVARTPERDTFFQDGPVYHRARAALEAAKGETDCPALANTGGDLDPALNAILNGSLLLTAQNTAHQNLLALLLECLYPLFPLEEGLHLEALPELLQRMEEWAGFTDYLIGRQSKRPYVLFEAARRLQKTDTAMDSYPLRIGPEGTYAAAHPRGAASAVAEAVGLKRQAVDTALRASKAYTERALALAGLDILRRF